MPAKHWPGRSAISIGILNYVQIEARFQVRMIRRERVFSRKSLAGLCKRTGGHGCLSSLRRPVVVVSLLMGHYNLYTTRRGALREVSAILRVSKRAPTSGPNSEELGPPGLVAHSLSK